MKRPTSPAPPTSPAASSPGTRNRSTTPADRIFAASALFLVLALLAPACSGDPTGPGGAAPDPITELPRELSVAEEGVLAASNAFAFDLAGELVPSESDENLFFSPLSASMLLGMILNGADGTTYEEMQEVLGFGGMGREEINQGYRTLIDLLVTLDPGVTLKIGNSVWTDLGFPVRSEFQDRVEDSFDAEAREVDLQDPVTLDLINGWASDATNGRIGSIFDELPPGAVMVLLNAIYFDADWTMKFDAERTRPAPFTRPNGSEVTVDLMRLEEELPMARTEQAVLVDLPYAGEAFSMTVVLPHLYVSANELAAEITSESWETWTGDLADGKTIVHLPRFELEWESGLDPMLRALGMVDAFDPGAADFGRLTPGGGVWLDVVKQKAFVQVDEEGTQAAAVTGGIVATSAPAEVRVDRPFLFVLRERLTGTVLFLGVVNDPTA